MANLTLDPKYTKGKGMGDAVQKKEAAVMAALRDNAQKVDEIVRQVQAGEYVPQKETPRPRPSMGTILGNRRKAGIMAVQQATDQARRYARAVPESVLPENQRTNRYYSMPEVGPEVEELWKQTKGLAGMVHVRENDLSAQQNMIKRHEEELSHNISQLEEIENQYKQNPTQSNADLYNQAYSVYLESFNKYNRALILFNADYEDYAPMRDRYDAAAAEYNALVADQQKKYEEWRGTIRDEETIQTEMDLIDRQIAAGWERFFNEPAEYAPGITEGHPEVVIPAEIQELQERRALLDEEYEWSQYYKYRDLMDAEDFTERSKYVSTANGKTQSAVDVMMGNYTGSNSGWDDPLYEYINGNKEAGAYISNQAANAYGGDSLAAAYGRTTENKGESQRMTEEEISIFNYIYATRGKQAAHEYYNYLLSDLNQRQRQKEERYWRYQAAVDPVGSSVFSILMSPTKGLSYLGQTLDYVTTGKIDENAAYNKFVYTSNAIRNKVASNWGPVGSWMYQQAMSMGDFLLTTGITGGTNASLLIMGTGAAADITLDAKDRGLTDGQAFALGTVAGVAEAVCEKIGLDAVFGELQLGKGAGGYILTNLLAEGSEEGLTHLANLAADIIISKDQSEWQMMVDAYMAQGYTESEAFGKAFGDEMMSLGLDYLGGMLSGGFVGAGGAVIHTTSQNISTNKYYKDNYGATAAELVAEGLLSPKDSEVYRLAEKYQKQIDQGKELTGSQIARLVQANMVENKFYNDKYGDSVPELIAEGLMSPENSESYQLAKTYQEQISQGKKLSGAQIIKLVQANEQQMLADDRSAIQSAAEVRLRELGETGNVESIAGVLAKQAMGEKLTWEEQKLLDYSRYGLRVAKELNPRNIRAGGYDSLWAEGINTDRVNVEEYGRQQDTSIDLETEDEIPGLSLPSLDDVAETHDSVTQNQESVMPIPENVIEDNPHEPVSISEQMRQGQNMTGGELNVESEQIAQRAGAAQPGTQREAGAGVPDGSSQRNVGQSAGEQGGSLGSRTGQAAQRRKPSADEIRKRVYRQNLRRNIRTEPVSSKSLGVESGTDNATLIPVADEYLDDSLRAKAEQVYQETGKRVVYVLGPIEMIGKDDKVRMARGATLEDCILVRMDHDILAEKIADHEAYHAMTDYYRRQDLDSLLVKRIRERFSREELDRVLEKYKFALRGIYSEDSNTEDVFEASGGEVIAKKDRPVMQELLADAHAGINAFGAGATKFTETVNEFLRENNVSREVSVENGTAVPTGPPSGQKENTADYGGERYSIAEPFIDNNGMQFNSAVLLDTKFFDGLSPRNWGKRLRDFVEYRADTDPFILPVADEKGNMQQLQFANKQDRVTKNGHANHKVLDELSSGSDNISKLAVIHIDEIVETSAPGNPYYTTGNKHQWLDQNGWLHRNANVINAANGNIYNLTFDIAKARDGRHILYATNGKIKRVGNVQVNSLVIRGSGQNSNSTNTLAQQQSTVKRLDVEYQYALAKGDMAAAQRLVDKAAETAGYNRLFYHGAKRGGGFTTFRDWSYFTENENYAKRYSLRGDDSSLYKTYVKLERPFDTRNPADRRLFSKMRDEYGLGEIQDSGLPDWTDGYDISDFIDENDLDYDGIVLDEGGDLVNGRPVSRGLSYVVRKSAQIKSADPVTYDNHGKVIPLSQRFNAEKSDIRYSVDDEESTTAAKAEYDAYQSDIRYSIEDATGEVERYMDEGEGSSVFRSGWLRRNRSVTEGIVKQRPQTETVAFRRWFGESAAVNVAGEPLVVFHGTRSRFTSFQSDGRPIWFSSNPVYSGAYAGGRWKIENVLPGGAIYAGAEQRMIPAYIRAEHPADFGDTDRTFAESAEQLASNLGIDETQLRDVWMQTGMKERLWETVNTPEMVGLLRSHGYDSVRAREYGTPTWGVFDGTQAKSAVANSGSYDGGKADIRYSVDDESSTEAAKEELVEALRAMSPQEMMGDKVRELIDQYTAQKPVEPEKPKVEVDRGNLRRALTSTLGLSKEQSGKLSEVLDAYEDAVAPKRKRKELPKADVESKPTEAKKRFQKKMFEIFSVPAGQRAELNSYIASFADRIVKNGVLTEADRKAFFARMYEAGVVTVPADEYYAQGREYLKDGRIYVTDSLVADFGDDWADIRRRAFNAGIYLTRSQTAKDGSRNMGVDVWNAELSEQLPWLFSSEETDQRSMLEQIVKVAENGRDEQLSLAEYTALIAGEEFTSEDDVLDSLERQMEWAIKTFAQTAEVEIQLKDRNMRRVLKERADNAEAVKKRKADRELKDLQQKTLKQLQWLNRNRNRAPEELKATWDEVLGDIDIYAIGAANEMNWSNKHNATWKDLAQLYKEAMRNDPNFLPSKELEKIVTRLDAEKIEDMDLGALQDLYKAAIGLRTEFYNRNNVINDDMKRLFAEVYTDSKREIEAAPGGYKGGKLDKFVNLEQLTPMNVLQRMAGWDPDSAFYSMAKQLEQGERDIRAYYVKAQKMLTEFMTTHKDWMKRADGQGANAIWYEVEVPELLELGMGDKPIFGDTVKVYMTPAQKVHMYLESKNLDNLRHMTGGRTFADKNLYSKGKRQEAFAQGRTIRLAPETVRQLVSDLTEEEMELARILDQYYNTFATKEINRVSNTLYGYDKAMGKNYAPIYTNRNYTKTEFGVFDQTAEGVGNLKGRQYAVNPSYNIGAFDAFERHVDQTARFCGMAIPARNWTTLMNWREKNNSTGDVITHKWGEEGKRYITDLITTLQAGDDVKSDSVSSFISKLQSNYITAIFGANPSIVLKQLGSIPLAGAYLGAGNLPSPAHVARTDRELIGKYTQDLDWRAMGYSTPETKHLKDNPNWTQTNKGFRFVFGGGAITAMDTWAASVLWPWAENKVRNENPDLEVGTQEQIDNGESPFYKQVAKEFEDALARSQSVADEIHQSSLRKSKNPLTKTFTLFRSDSAQTYNAIRQKIGEARFYARTGADKKVVAAASAAAGTAFGALLLNAAWAEAVTFLMALWKKKDKRYRDEDEELTAGSVTMEMVSGMLGSFAGIVTGGEELFQVIGNLLTGEKWYGIETTGLEQLNDVLDTVMSAGGSMREIVAGAWDVLQNGGDLGEYFSRNSGAILGSLKDIAQAAVTYLPGLPASNVEAYLVGALKWISPELGAAYDDLFTDINKSNLSGKEGAVLESGVGSILADRHISESEDTAEALAELYEAGYRNAIPGNTPTKVTVNDEEKTLGAYQQQAYDNIWGATVSGALDDLVESDAFQEADQETRAKMLGRLYSYADDVAKAELFDDYEVDASYDKIQTISNAGLSLADTIAWTTETSGMKQAEKFELLREWDMSDRAKEAVIGTIIGTDMETESGNPSQYAKMQSAFDNGLEVDQYLDMRLSGANVEDYIEMTDGGMDSDTAFEFATEMERMEDREGENLADLDKWRVCVDFSNDVDDQLVALSVVMSDSQYMKVEIANDFGVTPDAYVRLQEIKPRYDLDGNGSYKNAEVKAAIDSMDGYTIQQKAVLWQLATGSTSARNNPYNRNVGQQVIDARAAAKARGEQEDDNDFQKEIERQWSGNG